MLQLDWEEAAELEGRLGGLSDREEARHLVLEALELTPFLDERRILDVGELPVHCEIYEADRADAPVVVFLPGIGTYVEMFCELLHGLARKGLTMVAVDPRGHGDSGGPRGLYTVEDVAGDVAAVIDRVEQDYSGPVGIFGYSIGARLALLAAERDERVRALCCHTLLLAESPPDMLHFLGWNSLTISQMWMPTAKVGLRSFLDVDRLLRGTALGPLLPYDDKIVWDYPIATLASVFNGRCRVLSEELGFRASLLIGDRDEVVDLDYERYLIRRMRHPFDLILVPGGGHMLPFDRVDDVVRAASRWLRAALV